MKKIKLMKKIINEKVQKLVKDGVLDKFILGKQEIFISAKKAPKRLRDWIKEGITLGLITTQFEIDNFVFKKTLKKVDVVKKNVEGETLH